MGNFSHVFRGETFRFPDLKTVLARASARRSGDELAGLAAASDAERVAARAVLADLPLKIFLEDPLIPYETDEVTRLIFDTHDHAAFRPVAHMTVGQFRDWLLSYEADSAALTALAPGLTPEMAAAASKLMRNQDLIAVARKCRVVKAFRNTVGLEGRLSSRLQPNHPTDDLKGIAASTLDGLLYGTGDAVIGINPATDSVQNCLSLLSMLDDLRTRYDIPTQTCVLTHVTNSIEVMNAGGAVDLVFQSIAGSQAANEGFGVNLSILREAYEASQSLKRGAIGQDTMYFETGQGAALSAGAHFGVDQQTIEARAYAVARAFSPLLVNTVVGFIGPEYLYDGKQIIRAGLEDHFCGKLLGISMGCDVCYTNHAEADQDDMDTLMTLLTAAGVNFVIAVPGADDVMLNYQSLSYHDVLYLRATFGARPAPEFEDWLEKMEMMDRHGRMRLPGPQNKAQNRLLLGEGQNAA
ncbi:ethanolamine ammonia-lyase subunit EutB [Acidocella aminolytica]|jgi:ethanolamine ammonia-lyase large subunit|uniref:Ethanolamine ammonia-lyase large subunit n=1 Tax=Acidocella aminolytica 101 = DSM 11237 TaxID=1120923 RepID=A0A0D6PJJ3_9PROT|nr:ethanolamine ammonia-lyase subunit EutB [Acidocella aminolytica]GAN81945.1 ethanolamine ammonia lyase large subunit [Acidocella aminolytica 101 = DSM 11237]GBQ38570.1 ethanolamine ammonia lyase large subunit [Acidocella aminolytica 101 = DSM 11237]SHE76365.1 Ethanolamine ammonia-lyase heavy chain [Acidocella aminolytica 101 = DSM 11237]